MCMIDKEWPKVKEESEVYVKQVQRLMFYFVNIEDDEMRKEMVKFCANVYKISKQDNYKKKQKNHFILGFNDNFALFKYRSWNYSSSYRGN